MIFIRDYKATIFCPLKLLFNPFGSHSLRNFRFINYWFWNLEWCWNRWLTNRCLFKATLWIWRRRYSIWTIRSSFLSFSRITTLGYYWQYWFSLRRRSNIRWCTLFFNWTFITIRLFKGVCQRVRRRRRFVRYIHRHLL